MGKGNVTVKPTAEQLAETYTLITLPETVSLKTLDVSGMDVEVFAQHSADWNATKASLVASISKMTRKAALERVLKGSAAYFDGISADYFEGLTLKQIAEKFHATVAYALDMELRLKRDQIKAKSEKSTEPTAKPAKSSKAPKSKETAAKSEKTAKPSWSDGKSDAELLAMLTDAKSRKDQSFAKKIRAELRSRGRYISKEEKK